MDWLCDDSFLTHQCFLFLLIPSGLEGGKTKKEQKRGGGGRGGIGSSQVSGLDSQYTDSASKYLIAELARNPNYLSPT